MATIENTAPSELARTLRAMDDSQLLAQDFVQQGAIHAVGHLLAIGCTEANASEMLRSLRHNAAAVREEAARRGKPELFSEDQTAFN
jgi:hypothetical protein